jgi:hypothetical protein
VVRTTIEKRGVLSREIADEKISAKNSKGEREKV